MHLARFTLVTRQQDFIYAAEAYGKIIISEQCLPSSMKTIKPVQLGGVAGGEKYICQGILFKFAVDHAGIYGGTYGDAFIFLLLWREGATLNPVPYAFDVLLIMLHLSETSPLMTQLFFR